MAQKVSELMTSAPVTLSSGQTVADAARAMREAGIGDVLVMDDGQLKGLVTDRDIVMRVVADGGRRIAGHVDPGRRGSGRSAA